MATPGFAKFLESFDSDAKTRGTQWEHVCKWFLETDPVYRAHLKKVWLWDKWPLSSIQDSVPLIHLLLLCRKKRGRVALDNNCRHNVILCDGINDVLP